jgi:hypothetical protein
MDFGTQIFKFFFFLMQLGASKFDALKCYVQWVLCHFVTHFGHISQKQRGQKKTHYI